MSEKTITAWKDGEMSANEKETLIKTIEQEAHDNEVMYWGCSQVVIDALQRHLNLGGSETFMAASAFAGGVGRTREACGALLGGVMAIGLAYGRRKLETGKVATEHPEFVEALLRANKFCERFKEKFGSLRCSDVRVSVRGQNYKEYTRYNTIESFEDHAKCGDVTGPAARLAAEIILQPKDLFSEEVNAFLKDLHQVRELQKGR